MNTLAAANVTMTTAQVQIDIRKDPSPSQSIWGGGGGGAHHAQGAATAVRVRASVEMNAPAANVTMTTAQVQIDMCKGPAPSPLMSGEEVHHAQGAATAVRVRASVEMNAPANEIDNAAQVHDNRKGTSQVNLPHSSLSLSLHNNSCLSVVFRRGCR